MTDYEKICDLIDRYRVDGCSVRGEEPADAANKIFWEVKHLEGNDTLAPVIFSFNAEGSLIGIASREVPLN